MNKKDFELVVRVMNKSCHNNMSYSEQDLWDGIVNSFTEEFTAVNCNFDANKFINACKEN
jgi:hypothetical protein